MSFGIFKHAIPSQFLNLCMNNGSLRFLYWDPISYQVYKPFKIFINADLVQPNKLSLYWWYYSQSLVQNKSRLLSIIPNANPIIINKEIPDTKK